MDKRERKRDRRGRERIRRRNVMHSFSSSPDCYPIRPSLPRMTTGGGVALRDDDFPILRPAIQGMRRRLDVKEPPTVTPSERVPVPPPNSQRERAWRRW
jgi:hypothetical protein